MWNSKHDFSNAVMSRVMDDLPFSRIWMENKLGFQRKETDTSK